VMPTKDKKKVGKEEKEEKYTQSNLDDHHRKGKRGKKKKKDTQSDLDAYQSALRRDLVMRLGIHQMFRPRTPRVPPVEGPGI